MARELELVKGLGLVVSRELGLVRGLGLVVSRELQGTRTGC